MGNLFSWKEKRSEMIVRFSLATATSAMGERIDVEENKNPEPVSCFTFSAGRCGDFGSAKQIGVKKKFRRSSHRSLFFFQILFIIFFLLSMLRCRFVIVDFRCVSFLETYFLCEWENERNHLPDSPIFKGKCINSRHYLVSTPFQDRSGFLTPLFF